MSQQASPLPLLTPHTLTLRVAVLLKEEDNRVGASLLPPLPLRHASTACPPLVASQLGLTDAVLGEMQLSLDASNGMSGDTFPAGLPCFLRHTIEPADKTMGVVIVDEDNAADSELPMDMIEPLYELPA